MAYLKINFRNIYFLVLIFYLFNSPVGTFGEYKHQKSSANRMINGIKAKIEATKHQVSLRDRQKDAVCFGCGHKCGGSLITYNVVLTAVHCFYNEKRTDILPIKEFVVVMGTLKRTARDENTLIFDIKKRYLAADVKEYWASLARDIAVLLLDGYVPVNHKTAAPIPLNRKAISGNTVCQSTGWGIDKSGNLTSALMVIDLPIIKESLCRKEANFTLTVNYKMQVYNCMICAGNLYTGQHGICYGDSGGPLVCNGVLTGIASWVINCIEANPRNPSIFANVSYYVPWIEAQLKNDKIVLPGGGGDGSGRIKCALNSIAIIVVMSMLLY